MGRYLRWIIGLVDSDTLPLNVSREMLQMHSSLKTIKKKLVRKALDMIRKIADSQSEVHALPKPCRNPSCAALSKFAVKVCSWFPGPVGTLHMRSARCSAHRCCS